MWPGLEGTDLALGLQRAAAVGDAEAFGTRALECPRVDLAAELAAAGRRAG